MALRLEKDRPGDVPGHIGAKVATITGCTVDGRLTITIDPPADNEDDALDIPMLLLAAIGGAGAEGVRGARALNEMVKGKGIHKQEALILLIQDGLVEQIREGKANVHRLTDAGRIALEQGGE